MKTCTASKTQKTHHSTTPTGIKIESKFGSNMKRNNTVFVATDVSKSNRIQKSVGYSSNISLISKGIR